VSDRSPLLADLEPLLAEPSNPLVEAAIAAGERVIGYTCSFVPEPLLSVDGLVPLRVRAPGAAGTPMADTYLSSVVCSYPRSVLELALEGRFDFLHGWVFAASCDHLRRLYDNLDYLLAPAFHHILDLPHRRGEAALAWFVDELGRLAERLAAHFGVATDAAALTRAIAEVNRHLGALRRIGELRRRRHPPLSGADFHRLMVASATAPRARLAATLDQLADALADAEGVADYRARLMVVGSGIDDPSYLALIESVGGLVVADRFCFGSMPGLEPIPEGGDPLTTLARHYLDTPRCPRMMDDFGLRVRDILAAVDAYAVDGVVVECLKFCDIWGVESTALIAALRSARVPVLRLEREYATTGEGQLRTRVQAFLESMGR
jgi:benzoyl-CoA reductase/2-hydroxyglutaryl-CoA dehydratase subunit BcrC/BadD/HgdB